MTRGSRLSVAIVVAAILCAPAAGQDRTLTPVVEGDVAPGMPQVYTATMQAGDVLSGTIVLSRGGAIALEIVDPSGARLKDLHLESAGQAALGLAAPESGVYRVQVSRVPVFDVEAPSSEPVHDRVVDTIAAVFELRTTTVSVAERMRGMPVVAGSVRYLSPRLVRLQQDLGEERPAALQGFWDEVRARGAPLVEPFDGRVHEGPGNPTIMPSLVDDYVLVTFLWRERYDTRNVHVQWPQGRPEDFRMTRLPGTDVWHKTVLVRKGSRLSYSLVVNDRADQADLTAHRDVLNSRHAWVDYPEYSLLELEGAPDESWFRRTPAARGTLTRRQPFRLASLGEDRIVSVYTPPGHQVDPDSAYPLLLIFDGVTYVLGFEAVPTLDNLIADGRIRPAVACFVTSAGTRARDIGPTADPRFAQALVTDLLPWLRATYGVSADPGDIVLGGYSAGGSGAARIALNHPEAFGNVLSQSGAFGSLFDVHPVTLAYRDAPRQPVRFYLDVGLYENTFADYPVNERGLGEGLTTGNRHFRDVLIAKGYDVTYRETGGQHNALHFRATFAESLLALLAPKGR